MVHTGLFASAGILSVHYYRPLGTGIEQGGQAALGCTPWPTGRF